MSAQAFLRTAQGTLSPCLITPLHCFNTNHKSAYDIDDNIGDPKLELVACLLLVYVLVFVVLWRGMVNSGKAAYVTASLPYIILTILFIVSLGLDGATDGIMIYLTPKWERMGDLDVRLFHKYDEAVKPVSYL